MEVGVYTVEDLYVYRERVDDMTVELIEGEFVVSPSPRVEHQVIVFELAVRLRNAVPAHLRVLPAPLDLRLSDRTVIQPDIMVVRKDVRYGRARPTVRPPGRRARRRWPSTGRSLSRSARRPCCGEGSNGAGPGVPGPRGKGA